MAATLPTVAYLAENRLFVKRPDRPCEQIESVFAEQLFERDAERRQRQAWRGAKPIWQLMNQPEQFNVLPSSDETRPIAFTSVARASAPNEMLYIMQIGNIGALLHYKLNEDYERRLVHRQNYEISELALHPTQDLMVCSVQYDDGSCNLAKADREGRKLVEITGGDSRDESPSWAPVETPRIVYQTAGVGRNAQGLRAGLGPYRLTQLDIESGDLTVLREDDKRDFLCPRLSGGGDLHYIQRPYNPEATPVGPLTHLKDAALFPFRLGRAIVHFFNAFSMVFSGKPLYTAGGPRRPGPNPVPLILWGRLINAQQSQRRLAALQGRPLVPADWQLWVRRTGGSEEMLASHVISYDLCEDASIVYTTGTRIVHRAADGSETDLDESRLVHKLAVIG